MSEKIAPADRATKGPFDVSEVGLLTPYLDFGAIRISPHPEMKIRADVDEKTKRVIALTLEVDSHRIQLQAFAATKTEGLWSTTLRALVDGIGSQGGQAEQLNGLLGPELHASVPAIAGQTKVMRKSVFVGVDGPRWFLRGVMSGPELLGPNYERLVSIFRSTAVNRGDIAMPPGDLLPLKLPTGDNE
ncbi:MAG: DUF3710 domain-containing protein [Aquiluna sp.]